MSPVHAPSMAERIPRSILDTVYQCIEFDAFKPGEAVIVTLMLAFLPYVLLRGLVTRVARRWVGPPAAKGARRSVPGSGAHD
jgi:hypothetical protein